MSLMNDPLRLPSIYITGAKQKDRKLDEWHQFETAMILRVDPDSGAVETAAKYVSPPDACPDTDPSIVFKAGSIRDGRMYVCTNTEILIYELGSFRQVGYISHRWFNDVHHVCPSANGALLVVSTGLDLVVEITPEGDVLRTWPVLGGNVWDRFSQEVDYRKVSTTKPHLSHPNFILELGEDLWVTRFYQKDAFCLTQPDRRVEFSWSPHDGVRRNGRIYYTTVNGWAYIVDEKTMTLTDSIDLNSINGNETHLGWTRGILPVTDDICWVGFSRLRPTKLMENLSWIRHGFKHYYRPTRIGLYDLRQRKLLREIDLSLHDLNVVFSILPEPAGV